MDNQQHLNKELWAFIEKEAPTSKELQRMCDAIGVSKQTLFNIRDNRSFPSVGTIMALATHYKIDINALLSGQPLNQAYGADEPVQKATPTVKQPEPVSLDVQKAIELAKLQVENEQLKERLDMLKDQVEELRNEKNALYVQLFAFDPTDPNSSNLGHKRQNMLRAGKLWGSDDATDLSVVEIMEREEQKRNMIGFDIPNVTPAKRSSFLTVTHGAVVFTKDKVALLAQA